MQIVRDNMSGNGCSTYLLKIRYTNTDAKNVLRDWLKTNPAHSVTSMTKENIKGLFLAKLLGYLPRRNVVPIAEWMFNISVAHGYIIEKPVIKNSGDKEYFVNPTILTLKSGPKTKRKESYE